ncbi:hypothetical protein CsSME_00027830 [Camellia sinensis var. sinensis]
MQTHPFLYQQTTTTNHHFKPFYLRRHNSVSRASMLCQNHVEKLEV